MPKRPKEQLTTIGGLALVAAFFCFVTAVIFGCITTTHVGGSGSAAEAPNVAAAGAACGFAIAGGLCMIAAAVAESAIGKYSGRAAAPRGPSDLPPPPAPHDNSGV
jgi:hypothetical protein